MMTRGTTMNMNPRTLSLVRSSPPRPCSFLSTPKPLLPSYRISYKPRHQLNLCLPRVLSRKKSGLSHVGIPWLPTRKSEFTPPRASSKPKDMPFSFRYPPMTKKPEFWWRILASIPYLMPLYQTWMYAETAYNLHPFLEYFERIAYPFTEIIGSLPPWFFMAYFFVGYLFIVRRKEWPHFLRFHLILGMLLEIFLQALGTASHWMPRSYYYGKLGMHFWAAVAFAHLFTVLECIRCALCGIYADVPFHHLYLTLHISKCHMIEWPFWH